VASETLNGVDALETDRKFVEIFTSKIRRGEHVDLVFQMVHNDHQRTLTNCKSNQTGREPSDGCIRSLRFTFNVGSSFCVLRQVSCHTQSNTYSETLYTGSIFTIFSIRRLMSIPQGVITQDKSDIAVIPLDDEVRSGA